MTNAVNLPEVSDAVQWYHKAVAFPLSLLAARGLGPLGGENSISAVIEAVLAKKAGQPVDFELSKTDQFFVEQLASKEIPDEMLEFRELSHEVQHEILKYWQGEVIDVIWLGAGIFTLSHPLLAQRKENAWHVWSDIEPRIVQDAAAVFDELKARGSESNIAYDIRLPDDVDRLNQWMAFMSSITRRLVIFGYGVTYALTMAENYRWLHQLELPESTDVLFVFNAPAEKIPLMPGIMAAFHKQRMMNYTSETVSALFAKTIPGSEIIWEKRRTDTRNGMWGTWLISAPAGKRRESR